MLQCPLPLVVSITAIEAVEYRHVFFGQIEFE